MKKIILIISLLVLLLLVVSCAPQLSEEELSELEGLSDGELKEIAESEEGSAIAGQAPKSGRSRAFRNAAKARYTKIKAQPLGCDRVTQQCIPGGAAGACVNNVDCKPIGEKDVCLEFKVCTDDAGVTTEVPCLLNPLNNECECEECPESELVPTTRIPTAPTWTPQTSGSTQNLKGAKFVNLSTGWVVGENGTILYTTNGGNTWITQTSGTEKTLWDVDFVDSSIGLAVGGSGVILLTTDGGSTWNQQNSDNTGLNGVDFVDSQHAWGVGFSGKILRTTDGGITWTAQTSGTNKMLRSVKFFNLSTGLVVGKDGMILRTTNGGVTWFPQVSGTTKELDAIDFVGTNIGWAVGQEGTIAHTTDEGITWTSQISGMPTNSIRDVSFADINNGWAVSVVSGKIIHTNNGGTSWTVQSSGNFPLEGVSFVDDTHGWAVGWGGTILVYS